MPITYIPAQFSRNREQILAAVEKVLSEGQVILRQEVQEFEQGFAEFVGARHAVGVGSGYDSLYLSLRAIELDPGDEVITVSHTCMATVGAIVNAGGKPILVDVRDDCNMDPDLFEAAIEDPSGDRLDAPANGRIPGRRGPRSTVIKDVFGPQGPPSTARVGDGIAGFSSPLQDDRAYGDAGTTSDDGFAAKTDLTFGVDREQRTYRANSRLDNLRGDPRYPASATAVG